ncbi:MAG: glycosyltransferase family 39 protein [Candidatus Hadarchaeum sp.]
MSSSWRLAQHKSIFLILALFIGLGIYYSVTVPLFEAPDEVWHYLYVKHIADGKGLPVYRGGETFPMRQEASQPPLLYFLGGWATAWIDTSDADAIVRYNPHAAIGTAAVWGNRNVITHTARENFPYRGTVLAAHLARFLCVLMGAGTVFCTYALARRLFGQEWLALAAAALNAFIPQFLFINASVNNDVLVSLLSALSLWLLVCVVQDGPSLGRLGALGVVLGLVALTKLNGLILMPLTALVLFVLAWRRGSRWSWLWWCAWTFAVTAGVCGWWYVRNWLLYRDPFGLQLMFAVMPARVQRPSLAELSRLFNGVFKSFWGVFGWFNVVMEEGIYFTFALASLLAILGVVWFLWTHLARRRWGEVARVGLLLLWSVAFLFGLFGWSQVRFPQGRMLFPAMPAIATLLVLGLTQWFPARYRQVTMTVLLVALFCLAVIVPNRYIMPAYARAPLLTEEERQTIPHPFPKDFGQQIRLLGYDLSEATVKPGTKLWVTLYWEALQAMDIDYSVFVHLVDDRGVILAQHDSYPSAGNDPTRDWQVRQARRDVHLLDVPLTVLAQPPLRIRMGWYNYATGQRLPVYFWEGRVIEFVELPVELELEGVSRAALTPCDFRFGGQIALTGYHVEPLVAAPGDTLRITLRWQALKTLNTDYTVFVHLMRTGAEIWGQKDHVPRDEQSPTSTWVAGQVITDAFELHISPDAPEDNYQLVVGLYESATIRRLPLPDGLDFVVIGQIAVKQP